MKIIAAITLVIITTMSANADGFYGQERNRYIPPQVEFREPVHRQYYHRPHVRYHAEPEYYIQRRVIEQHIIVPLPRYVEDCQIVDQRWNGYRYVPIEVCD